MTVNLVAALSRYYLTYPMQMGDMVEIVLGLLQVSALICTAATVWLATRRANSNLHRGRRIVHRSCVLTFLPSSADDGVRPGPAGRLWRGDRAGHPWAMVPDVMEVDELATGQRREATHYGILTFAQKGGTALALALMQAVLALTGYVAGAEQPPALLAIRLMIGPVPAVLMGLSAC